MVDKSTDRPLYEDLLKQRADLEKLVTQMIGAFQAANAHSAANIFQAEYERIVAENRKRESLT